MATAGEDLLSFDDEQILRLESDAIKGHTGKLLVLEPDPDGSRLEAAALRERAADRIAGLPRLRQRVEIPARGRAAWADAPGPDLDWHLAADDGAEPLGDADFRARAGEILAERLDHQRPLWRIDLVPLEGGRTGLVGRIHHAIADGVSAIRMVSELLWDELTEPAGPASAAPADPKSHPGDAGDPRHPEAEERRRSLLVRLPGALRRELSPGPDTVLDRHIGSNREVAWTAFPLERLRSVGHASDPGATVNDVVLASVAGGLRRWLRGTDSAPDTLKAQVPVCLHLRDRDKNIGTRDSCLNVDLPIAEDDPLERLRLISAETRERKLDHDADTLYDFFHALGRFGPLYRRVTKVVSGPREFALSVSNVPGPRERPTICGHELREFCSFAEPADRHALRVAVISLGGDLAFGLCSDPEAIGELNRLADALEASVAELEAATGA